MRYISDDNKVFNSEQECLEHEKVLKEEKIKREKLIAEKNKRKDEVRKAYDDFAAQLKKYSNDYGEPVTLGNFTYPLDTLFPGRFWRL